MVFSVVVSQIHKINSPPLSRLRVHPSWKRSEWSFVGVLLANLASLAVIWWFDWQVHALLIAYWLEAGVVGGIYVQKISRAEGTDDPESIRAFWNIAGEPPRSYIGKPKGDILGALLEQYVLIWLLLGLYVAGPLVGALEIEPASPLTVVLIAVSLVVSHIYSYWAEYLGNREYERRGPVSLLVEPAARFVALFGVVFIGGLAANLTQEPLGVVVVLIFFKTCADLFQHRRERKRVLRTHEH